MTERRAFLKTAGAVIAHRQTALSHRIVEQARALVRNGKLGRVAFCRVAHEDLLPTARYVLGPATASCIIGIEPGAGTAAFLGSRATLSMSGGRCRLFTEEG